MRQALEHSHVGDPGVLESIINQAKELIAEQKEAEKRYPSRIAPKVVEVRHMLGEIGLTFTLEVVAIACHEKADALDAEQVQWNPAREAAAALTALADQIGRRELEMPLRIVAAR